MYGFYSTLFAIPVFLHPNLGSYLCLYIWEKINTFFIIFGKIYTKLGKNKAFFGLGTLPVTRGKTGQIK